MASFQEFMKKSKKGGNYIKVANGESVIVTLDCDPTELESKESKFGGEILEVKVLDEEGKKKIWNVKVTQRKIVAMLAELEEGDSVQIGKTEPVGDQEHGRLYAKPVNNSTSKRNRDEDEEESEDDEEEETPKKKESKKVVDEDEDEDVEEDEEEEKPSKKKKKKSKKSDDDEDEEIDGSNLDF
jgi:hypothetical protein